MVVYSMLNVTVFAVYYNIYELKAVHCGVIVEVDGLDQGDVGDKGSIFGKWLKITLGKGCIFCDKAVYSEVHTANSG